MKSVYIVKRGDVIFRVTSNLKAAYASLIIHKINMDVAYLRSYMQLTRIFKKQNYYYVPSDSGPKWEISKHDVYTHFVK